MQIRLDAIETQHHVGKAAVAVRHVDVADDGAKIEHLDLHALAVRQGKYADVLAIGQDAERQLRH
ncbi:hypothetical protein D3C79_1121420 [compost metagenome]